MMRREFSGYFTVEATFIMTFVLYVCVFILYMGFFQYNRCIMQQNAYRIALRASSFYRDNNKEVFRVADQVADILCSDRYIALTCEREIAVNTEVSVTLSGKMQFPGMLFRFMQGTYKVELSIRKDSHCLNPVIFIRTCRQLKQLEE